MIRERLLKDGYSSFVVHGSRGSRYMSPTVKSEVDAEGADRCMILIDFSPMVQRI